MIDTTTSVTLLAGLSIVAYALVTIVLTRITTRAGALAAIGLAPAVVWVIAPEALAAGSIDLPFTVRRPAILLIGAALAVRYLSARTDQPAMTGRIAGIASAICFWSGLSVTSGNWLVSVGALVAAVVFATAIPRHRDEITSAASGDAPGRRRRDRQAHG